MSIEIIVFLTIFCACIYFWVGFGAARIEAKLAGDEISLVTVALWPVALMIYATGFGL